MKSSRRRLLFVSLLILLTLGIAGCTPTITVTPSLVTIAAGESIYLQAASASRRDASFTWSSADSAIASVDAAGMVTGVNEGQTTVTARGSASGAEGKASVTVNRPPDALSELDISVDTSIVPATASLPPFTSGAPDRPLAAVIDERGNQAEFVEDELILVTDDSAALDAFVARWDGEVLTTIDPAGTDIDMPRMHLVRIDTALGDPSSLKANVLTLDPDARGADRVSSEAGLRLISAGISEAVAGTTVGINWVGRGSSLDNHSTAEAATGPSGFNSAGSGYSPDAFDWNFLDKDSVQDIGVTEAWYLLSKTHKSSNKIKVAILDMGFSVEDNDDVPANWEAISNVPFIDPIGTSNLSSCTGGTSCPWHGTEVLDAAMGVPDNGFGGAGPAGPVAKPIMVFTSYDFATGISAIIEARALGARVVNMSYGTPVPAVFAITVVPFEIATAAAAHWMVLCASAGNNGKNVDAKDCFIVCWEETWWTPCENDGVLCVGGLAANSKYRAANSNYGSKNVDIFAPYSVIVGPYPGSGSGAQEADGTSFSSPFVAGVAALVLAADPYLSASDVRDILKDTAHTSPDSHVKKYVDAYAAVAKALGPTIVIDTPEDYAVLHLNHPVYLSSFVYDAGLGTPAVRWTSSVDGLLGTDASINIIGGLSYGSHVITAHATFPDDTVREATVTVTVINDPPSVGITSPSDGAAFYQGQPVLLAGTSTDINEPPNYQLTDAQLSWYVDNVFVGRDYSRTIAAGTLSFGSHEIKLIGTDGHSSVYKTVSITVNPNPVDLPPDQVNITSPTQGADLSADVHYDSGAGAWYVEIAMTGNAHDPEDGDLTGSALKWTVRENGGASMNVGSGSSLTWKRFIEEGKTTFDITLTAKDSAYNASTATIQVSATIILK